MKVIIVGGGQTGLYLTDILKKNKDEVKVIEHRTLQQKFICETFGEETLVAGYGSDPELLEKAGIKDADVVAAVSGIDELNLVVTTLAKKQYNVPRVIGRVNDPKCAWLYTPDMGVDALVNQADIISKIVMEEISLNHMSVLMEFNKGDFEIIQTQITGGSAVVGQEIRNITFPVNTLVIGVKRDTTMIVPNGGTVLLENDEILVLTTAEGIIKIRELIEAGTKN